MHFTMCVSLFLAAILGIFGQVHKASETQRLNSLIDGILIERVPGSSGNLQVQDFITSRLKAYGYEIETDRFTDKTPKGDKEFTNIIGSQKPKSCDRLVLACHFDSKDMEGFLGATDSAVPCAMLLYIADQLRQRPFNAKSSIDMIFFDGEEAFNDWSDTDSLYGSRHLAAKWSTAPADGQGCGNYSSRIKQIKLFVLLDLIGAKNPTFHNQFPRETSHDMNQLINIQQSLKSSNRIQASANYFNCYPAGPIDDDHKPFLKHAVKVVHLIAVPFPDVWHKNSDNRSAIDINTTLDLTKIVQQFAANYLVNRSVNGAGCASMPRFGSWSRRG
ncbi:Glutaminyl-peptide cyclotransferase-like protein [Halotydeus destructor]|nr:Glutaminyl-peptide cyclotransferase-like protein [Halotydeus destructor]